MYDVPKEFAELKQAEIDKNVNVLWEQLIKASYTHDKKECRKILDSIDRYQSSSILLWDV